MNKHLTDGQGEVREITAADIGTFQPAAQVLPPHVFAMLTAPQRAVKTEVVLRLDPDVAAAFTATGKGWQTRINEILRREIHNI